MSKFIDLTGQVFGKLTVLRLYGRDKSGNIRWLCQCKCGGMTIVSGSHLINNNTRSCGCLSYDNALTHGHSKQGPLKDYSQHK